MRVRTTPKASGNVAPGGAQGNPGKPSPPVDSAPAGAAEGHTLAADQTRTETASRPPGRAQPSTDYHDYVFRNGKLLGDFEGMYRHSAEVPWHQDKTAHDISANLDIAILAERSYDSICDVGAGLGHVTQRLHSELCTHDDELPAVTGFDISPTAVTEATRRWPGIRFVQADLLSDTWRSTTARFDLVVAKDILWYVCHRLNKFLNRLVGLVNTGSDGRGGWLHVSQSFPASEDWVGRDVIPSHDALLEHIGRFVEIDYHCAERDARWGGGSALHILSHVDRSSTCAGLP